MQMCSDDPCENWSLSGVARHCAAACCGNRSALAGAQANCTIGWPCRPHVCYIFLGKTCRRRCSLRPYMHPTVTCLWKLECWTWAILQRMPFIGQVRSLNSFCVLSLALGRARWSVTVMWSLAGVSGGSHSSYRDVCVGVGGCHCWAVRSGHGCLPGVALACPPAGATYPLWTPVLPSYDVSTYMHTLRCIYSHLWYTIDC